MKTIFCFILLIFSTQNLTSSEDFKYTTYHSQSTPKVYLNRNIDYYCQRLNLSKEVEISEITIGFFSNKKNTTAELKIFGEEGQQSIPRNEINIIEPIRIEKRNKGYEQITIKLNKKLLISDLQFFIVVSDLSNGLYILTDDYESSVLCSNVQDIFTGQYLKSKNDIWEYTNYNFDITIKGNYVEKDEEEYYFEEKTKDLFSIEDLQKINSSKFNNLTIFDIDNDGSNEITVNNQIYYYDKLNKKYKLSKLSSYLDQKSILNYYNDYNFDGKIDLLQVIQDSLDIKYFKYQLKFTYSITQPKIRVENYNLEKTKRISSFQLSDLNNDNFIDFIVTQSDTLDQLPNLIILNNGKSFVEIQISDKINFSFNGEFAVVDKLVTRDKSSKNILLIDNNGKYETWELKENLKFKLIDQKGSNKKSNTDSDSIMAIIYDYDYIVDNPTEESEIITANKYVKLTKNEEVKNKRINGKNISEKYEQNEDERVTQWCVNNTGLALGDLDNNKKKDIFYFVGKSCYNNNLFINPNTNTSSSYKLINRTIINSTCNLGKDGIFSDYNEDGKLDLFSFRDKEFVILKNTNTNSNNWIVLKDKQGELFKNGDYIKLYLKDKVLDQELSFNNAWLFQSPNEIHFGLLDEDRVDSVLISDVKGNNYIFKNLDVNKVNYLPENRTKILDNYSVEYKCFPNPFTSDIKIDVISNIFKHIKISIEDINGNEIKELFNEKQKNQKINLDWDGRDKNNQIVPTGTYFVILMYKNYIFSNKIIKN